MKHVFMAEAGDQGGGGGAPAPTPAEAPSPAATPAAPASAPVAAPAAPAEDKGYWPGDWRERVSKGDAKIRDRLGRYDSPQAVADALIHAQDRISKGEVKPVLSKEATPEQIAEWRQAHGIPESHDKYDITDLKAPEKDKPFIDHILKVAHSTNQTPEQAKSVLKAYYDVFDQVSARQAEEDKKAQTAGEDALRSEWGAEYRLNSNLIANMLAGTTSGQLSENLMNGRLADGTLVRNSPEMQRFLLSLALVQNPTATVVPGGGNPAEGIRQELEKIEKTMRTDRTSYNRDERMQARYRELTGAAIRAGIKDERGDWKS